MDALDRMQADEDLILDAAIRRQRSALPPAAAGAIARKRCSSRGGPIAPARLRALPGADRCIDCQRELEGAS